MLPTHRPRRNRKSEVIRNMVQETRLTTHDFIYPISLPKAKTKPRK